MLQELICGKKVITISGAHSKVGKTLLDENILSRLQGFCAIKTSVGNFKKECVTDNPFDVMVPNKDTFRLKNAGAEKVIFVQCSRKDLSNALKKALKITSTYKGVIIEGNSVLKYIDPSLAIFVANENVKELKESALLAIKKADIIVFNEKTPIYKDKDKIRNLIKTLNNKVPFITWNLTQKTIPLLLDKYLKELSFCK